MDCAVCVYNWSTKLEEIEVETRLHLFLFNGVMLLERKGIDRVHTPFLSFLTTLDILLDVLFRC